jgi:hypothetical protein
LFGFGEPADGERCLGEVYLGSEVIGVPLQPGLVKVEGFCEGKQLILIKKIQPVVGSFVIGVHLEHT